MENTSLQQNTEGNNEIHHNQAKQNVMQTVDSALKNKTSIAINGRANDIANTFSNSVKYEKKLISFFCCYH